MHTEVSAPMEQGSHLCFLDWNENVPFQDLPYIIVWKEIITLLVLGSFSD